jgi:cysteine desulfurase family protein
MIYLDNAATSFPKAPGVAEAVARQLAEGGGSAGRAGHAFALDASRVLFEAREELARILGLPDARRLVFCKSATEALNLALLGALPAGGTVAASDLEHNSVMRPLRHLESSRGLRILVFGCDAAGNPRPGELEAALAAKPDLLVATAASNVTGALLPIGEIALACRKAGVPICVDGSQITGHAPIDVEGLGIDYFCFSGHKGLLGPGGTGGLCLGPGTGPEPLLRGGTGSASESEEQPVDLPDRYEAGTQNVSGLAGLLAAARFLEAMGLEKVRIRERAITDRLVRGLAGLKGVALHGPPAGISRAPIVSLSAPGIDLGELARALDGRGVAARAGLHCAPAAHRSIGTFVLGGSLRLSPGFFTTEAEVDETLRIMEELTG